VEPHYFAGFTGGRKSFVPGCASFETIEANHRHALEPGAQVLALEGNPVHDDLVDAFRCLGPKPLFTLQAVFDRGGRIRAAFAGGFEAAFRRAVEASRAEHCVAVPGPADVVVAAVAPPLDVNLYQAHKAAENARPVLAPGGIFILVAPCRQGVGNDAFVRLLSSESDPRRVEAAARAGYRLGYHKSARIASFVQTAQFWAVTDLPADVLRPLFIRPFAGVQEALDEALRQKPQGRFLIVQSAGTTVPFRAGAAESTNPRVP
jgi:nickel-dependent lactate racemase